MSLLKRFAQHVSDPVGQAVKRFLQDERGAEVIQFALVLPLFVGIVWFSTDVWQLMTLRAAVRSTATQAARYISEYAAPPEEVILENPEIVTPQRLCDGVAEIIATGLGRQRGNMGDNLQASVGLHKVANPMDSSNAADNVELLCGSNLDPDRGEFYPYMPLADWHQCCSLNPGLTLECNDQFVLVLHVEVPWRTLLLGLDRASTEDRAIVFDEVAMGTAPCQPFLRIEGVSAGVPPGGGGPGGCVVRVSWNIESSMVPDRVEIWAGNRSSPYDMETLYAPQTVTVNEATLRIPFGSAPTIYVRAYAGAREEQGSQQVSCP
ncbi:MAG: pilus assembly protein [Anaerolineae bacterium]|nr:pilus assembly protein [Anaerolineae bacterium]